jgi:hypothetical protein
MNQSRNITAKKKLAFYSKENPELFPAISKPAKGCSWG